MTLWGIGVRLESKKQALYVASGDKLRPRQ